MRTLLIITIANFTIMVGSFIMYLLSSRCLKANLRIMKNTGKLIEELIKNLEIRKDKHGK